MKGFPPPLDQRVTLDNWAYSSTGHWRWAHLNPDRLFKTVQIESGDTPVWVLGYKNLFWNSAVERGGNPVFHAAGGWGQKCLIAPARQDVVVQLASAWDHDPERIANNAVGNHAEVAVWSFMQDVIPALVWAALVWAR